MLKLVQDTMEDRGMRLEAIRILRRIGTGNSIAALEVVVNTERDRSLKDAAKLAHSTTSAKRK